MILVFDVGATRTRMAVCEAGELNQIVRMDTDRSAAGFAKFLGALQELVGGQKLRAIVGGLPGQVEGEEGELVLATNLPGWLRLPVKLRLEKQFGCPVYVSNDVVLNGLGEAWHGAGSGKGVMAYFTVSTGVNAVRLVDGRVDSSISRYEVGKQLMADSAGELQTLEQLTGGAAMQERRGKAPRDVRDGQAWRSEDAYLARGLYNTFLHWTPELVVLGGSMMRDIDLKVVAEEIEQLPAVLSVVPRLAKAKLGDEAGLHGAMVWFDQLQKS